MQGRVAKQGRAMKSALVVSVVIALSKLTGFVREIIMAAVFGRSVASDAYGSAYSILSLMTLLFTAGLSSTFIPMYMRARTRQGQKAADKYASNMLTLYLLAGLAASAMMYFLAPLICTLVFRAPQGLDLTIQLTRMMYPTLAFYAMTGVLFNILNARERFIPEQLMGFVLSLCLIAACMFRNIRIAAVAVAVVAVVQFLLPKPASVGPTTSADVPVGHSRDHQPVIGRPQPSS
jgi:putative peptidoglycan lipid II flippase